MRIEGRDVDVATEAGTAAILQYQFTDDAFTVRDTALTLALDVRQKPVPESAADLTYSLLLEHPDCTAQQMAILRGVTLVNARNALNDLVAANRSTRDETARAHTFRAVKADS